MLDISSLNASQKEAVTAPDGPILVIAGAGSGKTRTIVYRLAWLAEQGIDPASMLLLTFTRKASQEMLNRASILLERPLFGIQGGTFHGFAFSVLRRWAPDWTKGSLSIMDTADCTAAIQNCREEGKIAKGDRSFPKAQAVLSLISKSRNKETDIDGILGREAQHLLPHAEDLAKLGQMYTEYKRKYSLLDYDDLLFELERLLLDNQDILQYHRKRFSHLMVDEYQDTNKVQARLVKLLAGEGGNVMAVGDDAQSIYAFRGATVRNILNFSAEFPDTRIIRLEENYRSVQPILDIANCVLEHSTEGYQKHLYSHRNIPDEPAVTLYRPFTDLSQAQIAAKRIEELLDKIPPSEIAVLFRSGYQSYNLEVELNKRGIPFKKYGGLRYAEAAHIKDVLAFARLVGNPLDIASFRRVAALCKGIGPKTAQKLFTAATESDETAFLKAGSKYPDFLACMDLVHTLRTQGGKPAELLALVVDFYRPKMEELFPEDYPRRIQGLEEMMNIASNYDDLQLFIGDLSLDGTEEDSQGEEEDRKRITLSTIHSAKGLEWSAVLILDLVEDRFPSARSIVRPEDFEEERRLMYVACTRAKDTLDLFVPISIFSRASGGREPAVPSPFVRELPQQGMDELFEGYGGTFSRGNKAQSSLRQASHGMTQRIFEEREEKTFFYSDNDEQTGGRSRMEDNDAFSDALRSAVKKGGKPAVKKTFGFCRHRIFGRGKILEEVEKGKYRVNFPGIGLKTILEEYLTLE